MLYKSFRKSCVQLHDAMVNLLQYAAPLSIDECGDKLGEVLEEISGAIETLEKVINKLPADIGQGKDGRAPIVDSADVKSIVAIGWPIVEKFDTPDLYQSVWAVELYSCQLLVSTRLMSFYIALKDYFYGDYRTLPSNVDRILFGLVGDVSLNEIDHLSMNKFFDKNHFCEKNLKENIEYYRGVKISDI